MLTVTWSGITFLSQRDSMHHQSERPLYQQVVVHQKCSAQAGRRQRSAVCYRRQRREWMSRPLSLQPSPLCRWNPLGFELGICDNHRFGMFGEEESSMFLSQNEATIHPAPSEVTLFEEALVEDNAPAYVLSGMGMVSR